MALETPTVGGLDADLFLPRSQARHVSRLAHTGHVLRYAGHLASPIAMTGLGVLLGRAREERRDRALAAVRDKFSQRRRRTRPEMRALSVAPGGRFTWRSVPQPPAPGPLGALVHPIAIATCDLDRALALGATGFPMPLHFGHECVADVLEVGEWVTGVKAGDRVVVPFQISCGSCPRCIAGLTSNCASVPPLSMYGFGVAGGHWGGAFSDVLAVPYADGMLVPLPAGVEPAAAASAADNIPDAYRHVAGHLPAILDRDPDATVVIVAAQTKRSPFSPSLPLYTGLIARALGARNVVFVDARRYVRSHADRLGFTAIEPGDLPGVARAPLVVAAGGSASGLRSALMCTDDDGICSSMGGDHNSARIPTGIMFARNITYLVGRANARAAIPHVLELIVDGAFDPALVTTHTGAIDRAVELLASHTHGTAVKTVLTDR